MRSLKLILLSLFLLVPSLSFGDEVVAGYLGVNGCWVDNQAEPADFELGGTARASLSPHISAVGGAWFGTGHSYLRGTIGARFTATDVTNPNFSVGLGAFYQASSEPAIRSEEVFAETSIGFRPWPASQPRIILIGQGAYGMDSQQAVLTLGARYKIGGQP